MKKTLSSALWTFTLSAFVATACTGPSHKETQNTQGSNAAVANTNSVIGGEGQATSERPPAPGDQADIAMPAVEESEADESYAELKSSADQAAGGAMVPTGRSRRYSKTKAEYRPAPAPLTMVKDRDDRASNSEGYTDYGKNPMVNAAEDRLSTFAIDVDTASYAISRRKLNEGGLPPATSVRVEEFVNYFKYDLAGPTTNEPFAVHMDMAPSPFAKNTQLLKVAVQAKKISKRERKAANLVFLVDVSGSMQSADKLELAKRALRVLVDNLQDGDTVALVTYAGSTRVVLEPTGLENKGRIVSALEDLRAGGLTAMASGMELAYDLAAKNLGSKSESRVIVLSDGDANVGNTNHKDILRSIKGKVNEGVTMSTVGFGMGNYKDDMMEQLANSGNGNYFYIDGLSQAKRVFQEQLGGTLEVVAKDVKIQVDFDPEHVESYRLVGYENRDIADHQFRDDKVDAGEIGAGHSVTAMYEVRLKEGASPEGITVRMRAKTPRGSKAKESAFTLQSQDYHASFETAPEDFRFASAVMGAAEILRKSEHATNWKMRDVIAIAKEAQSRHKEERTEFVALMENVLRMK